MVLGNYLVIVMPPAVYSLFIKGLQAWKETHKQDEILVLIPNSKCSTVPLREIAVISKEPFEVTNFPVKAVNTQSKRTPRAISFKMLTIKGLQIWPLKDSVSEKLEGHHFAQISLTSKTLTGIFTSLLYIINNSHTFIEYLTHLGTVTVCT